MAFPTYDPAKHLLSFASVILTGAGMDQFIKVTRDEDSFTKHKGVSGEGGRSKNNNRGGSLEFTVLAQSQVNDILSAMLAGDELLGTGVGAVFLKELNGTTVVSGENGWLKRVPDLTRAKVAGEVTWIIDVDDLEIFHGGLTS